MYILILLIAASSIGHSYQLFQPPKSLSMKNYHNQVALILSPQGNRFITIYQSNHEITLIYATIESDNNIEYYPSKTINNLEGQFKNAYWSLLQSLILVFTNGICHEFIPNFYKDKQNTTNCMSNIFKEDNIVASAFEEQYNSTYIYSLVLNGYFIKYSINPQGNIQRVYNFTITNETISSTSMYNIMKLGQYDCVINNRTKTFIHCFDFINFSSFSQDMGQKFKKAIRRTNQQILFVYKQPLQIFRGSFASSQPGGIKLQPLEPFLDKGQQCLNQAGYGKYLLLFNKDSSNRMKIGLYYRYKQSFKQYQHIPFSNCSQISILLSNPNKIIIVCTSPLENKLFIFDQVSYIDLNYIIPFVFLGILLVMARFSLFKFLRKIKEYPMAIQWSIVIGQTLMVAFLFAFLIIVMMSNDIQQKLFVKNFQDVSAVGSYFSRILYYVFVFNSVIFVLCQLQINNIFKNKKLNMLKKHGLIFSYHISIRALSIIVKSMIYGFIAISFVCITQKLHLEQQQRAFSSFIKIINIWSAYTVCLSNLVIFAISLNLIISSFWYSTQINLAIIYFTVAYTQHLVEYKTNTVLQNFFILVAPTTNFYTILQAILQTQFRYAMLSKITNLFEVFMIILSNMVAFSLFYTIYIVYSYRQFDLKNIIKVKPLQGQVDKPKRSLQSQNTLSIIEDSEQAQPFLSVFIPCKFNVYNGFEKNIVLQNIRFKANRNQIITFIDYKNVSKHHLFKILINDLKSDSFIEQNNEGQIIYSQDIKLSYCLDGNYHYEQLSALEHLQLFLRLKIKSIDKKQLQNTISTMLNEFNIPEEEAVKKAKYLSGGYLKKMSLACVFIGNPDVIIVDQPTQGLDIRFKRIFWEKIRQLKENRLIIVGTSDSEEAQAISDKIWILERSKMIDYAVYKRKKLMISVSFSFFTVKQFSEAIEIVKETLERQSISIEEQTRRNQFIICLSIYTIQEKVCSNLMSLMNKFKTYYRSRYYFSFKIIQNKFHSHQYSKYYNNKCSHCNRQQILSMIQSDLNDIYQLDQILYREKDENIFKKKAEDFLLYLSKQEKRNNNLNLSQLKAIIYQRYILVRNKNLHKRQLLFTMLYFWLITLYYLINKEQSTYLRWIAFVKLIVVYQFLHIKMIYIPLENQGNKKYLMTIGLNYRCYWIGNWIANLLYLFIPIVVNIVIWFAVQYTIYMQVQLNIFLCITGAFFYTVNFIITIIFFSSLTSNYAITFIILSIINIFPLMISKDIYLIKYTQYNFPIIQLIQYIYYPISFAHFVSQQTGKIQWDFIYVMAYQYLMTLLIFLLIQLKQASKLNQQTIDNSEYANRSNESIRQEQAAIDNIIDPKSYIYGQNIIKKYKKNVVLQNIYFSIKQGEVFGFLGHNGSGKTTLFKIITNKINSTAGNIYVFGQQNSGMSHQQRLKVGYCPQFYKLYAQMTLEQNIRFIGMLKGLEDKYIAKYITLFFQYFRMKGNQKMFIKYLTEGQRRKFSIIVSFLGFPKLLLFDETTTGIDTQSRLKSINLIKTYCNLFNSAVLITSHNISEAEQLCDRVCILKSGKIIKSGTPSELKRMASQQFYRLIINFKIENSVVVNRKIEMVKSYVRSLVYINISVQQGFKLIYSLDMIMLNMENVLRSLLEYFKDGVIEKFSFYKHDLEEVVKYAMNDESELAQTQTNSEAGDGLNFE